MRMRSGLGWLSFLHNPDDVRRIGEIAVMQEEPEIVCMPVFIEVIHTAGIERRRPPFNSVEDISFAKQQFREVGAVLTGHTRNQRNTLGHILPFKKEANENYLLSYTLSDRVCEVIQNDIITLTGLAALFYSSLWPAAERTIDSHPRYCVANKLWFVPEPRQLSAG
jgi:hypothetical protein